ncbi:hypothetical protein I6J42_00275 [Streptomyces californicus]|uniref:Uncharacterized protein n=2 Tax=Streptomyces TaxID=1883 RepID=A0ABD7CPY4_9ACTN|nr:MULTISPECIES: hypothetical protein [Streptomyces]AGZ94152.1 hypothetical protein [Streptomyces sp. MMG1522]KOU45806.1 hypothetical protein ADK56_31850 [Streptomyces sp. MMG1522]QRV31778.1 hypothetical protein I6J39_33805 [Streptomyces californicus]QRV32612.1 hypothetical protein I6J42_00275 [Streptomyces californicus]QRV45194.1 hypothetical protein I6J41_33745 [Streptomyces californicus]
MITAGAVLSDTPHPAVADGDRAKAEPGAEQAVRVLTAVRPVKRIGVKKTANLIRTYAEGRELTATRRKAVTALLGISAIRTVRTF